MLIKDKYLSEHARAYINGRKFPFEIETVIDDNGAVLITCIDDRCLQKAKLSSRNMPKSGNLEIKDEERLFFSFKVELNLAHALSDIEVAERLDAGQTSYVGYTYRILKVIDSQVGTKIKINGDAETFEEEEMEPQQTKT